MKTQLHKVISQITGLPGMRIITAMPASKHDLTKPAYMRALLIESSTGEITKPAEGEIIRKKTSLPKSRPLRFIMSISKTSTSAITTSSNI